MSEYMMQPAQPQQTILKSKEARAKQLAAIRQRRRIIYNKLSQKLSQVRYHRSYKSNPSFSI